MQPRFSSEGFRHLFPFLHLAGLCLALRLASGGPANAGLRRWASHELDDEVLKHLRSRGMSPPITDGDQAERTRRHYDGHARVHATTADALRQRQQGKAIQLKKFHNDVKRKLISCFAHRCDRLLDLACGRGGDLDKWFSAGVGEVVGVDLSGAEIVEARRRFSEMERDLRSHKKRPREECDGGAMRCEFFESDQLGVSSMPLCLGSRSEKKFGAVTCMFALHYFYETEDALKNFMRTVEASLKPGGYFFGVLVDGRRVNNLLRDSDKFRNSFVRIKREYMQGKYEEVREFGSPYVFALQDTVTGEIEDSGGSREFLTKEETLVRVAKEFGLEPVRHVTDQALEGVLSGCRSDSLFKHFRPRYSGPNSEDLEKVSELNAAFIFMKPHAAGRGRSHVDEMNEASGSRWADRLGGDSDRRGAGEGGGDMGAMSRAKEMKGKARCAESGDENSTWDSEIIKEMTFGMEPSCADDDVGDSKVVRRKERKRRWDQVEPNSPPSSM